MTSDLLKWAKMPQNAADCRRGTQLMNGHGEKLSRKQEAAIGALLNEPTLAKAAKQAGIAERTLRNWLKLQDFQAAFRQARCALVNAAVADLQRISADAVATLKRNLKCGNASVEVRAALGVLERVAKHQELEELAARVEDLENGKIDFRKGACGREPKSADRKTGEEGTVANENH